MMKKDFITDRLGKYGDPDGNFVIKGNQFNTPITTKYLQDSTLVTTPDGTTTFVPPGQEKTFNNPYVLEMKYQAGAQVGAQQQQLMQLISMYCQVVGGGDESCSQKVAKSLQKNPEQMIQQMTATIQQAQQEQGMEQEESEEDMMRDGGCIDCQEAFPQAQNLNWFYKAQGGKQVAARDATTVIPAGIINSPAEFLAPQLGGPEYNQVLQNMLISGLVDRGWGLDDFNVDAAKKLYKSVYGKELDDLTARAMIRRKEKETGVNLNWATGIPIKSDYAAYLDYTLNPPKPTLTGKAQGGTAFPAANTYPTNWASYSGESYAAGGGIKPAGAQTYLPYDRPGETRPNFMFEYGGQTIDQIYDIMKRGGLNYDPKKKKGKQETFEQYMMRMGGLAKYQAENSQVGPPTEYDDFAQRSTPIYDETETDYELPPDDSDYDSDLGPDLGIMGDYDPTDLFNATRSGRRIERRAQRQKMREQRRGVREERQKLNQYFRDNPSIPAKPQTGVPATGTAQQTNTGQPGAGQQQQQNQGFGPGSQYDLTVKQRQAANPYAAYTGGRNLTNMFGNQFGAGMSILNALGATGSSMFNRGRSRISYVDPKTGKRTRARNSAADIAAAGLFGNMFSGQGQQQTAGTQTPGTQQSQNSPWVQSYIDQRLPILNQLQTPKTQGGFRFFGKAGGENAGNFKYSFSDPSQMNIAPSAFSAGVADQFSANRLEELREQMMNRSAMATAPITTATKTQMGSPQGAVNAPSFVPFTTEASRATDAFMPQRLMFGQMGGMMDELEDGAEVDLSDMTPQERDEFFRQVYAAGGTIEFM